MTEDQKAEEARKHDAQMENASRVYADVLRGIAKDLWHYDIKALIVLAEHMKKHNQRTLTYAASTPAASTSE